MTVLARYRFGAFLLLWPALPATGLAQIRASERGSLSQTVDGTVITVDYARPRARGRDTLFGGVVKWDEVWTPGANYATTLEVSKDLTLDGHRVPKGKYSVWMIVRKDADWTVVLDPRHHRYHTDPPDSTAEQVRYAIHPGEGPFTEALTWSAPEIRVTGCTLAMQWGTTRVALDVKVEPTHALTVARQEVAALLGRYRFAWTPPPPDSTKPATDTTRQAPDTAPPMTMTLTYENGMLMARLDPPPFPEAGTLVMIRIAPDWFTPAMLQNGEVYDVWSEWVFEFARSGGRVTGFEVRGDADRIDATGTRLR
jgi:DUF2911 family protein